MSSVRSGIITLTTDFGADDTFVGVVKGVILGVFPEAKIIDLTHRIPPQDVSAAAWALKDSVPYFPEGTVHLAVVDPGVGSERRGIALRSGGHIFMGPDNGIFSAFYPADLVVELNRPEMFLPRVSPTFHGRDVFAPVAAKIASGVGLADVGDRIHDPVVIELPEPRVEGDRIIGEVVSIDRFGNLVTNVPESMIPPGAKVKVEVRGAEVTGLSPCYSEPETENVIALIGSAGRLEIAMPNGSAADELSAVVGDEVAVRIS
jgi:S-adenosylmethionine hydrolase